MLSVHRDFPRQKFAQSREPASGEVICRQGVLKYRGSALRRLLPLFIDGSTVGSSLLAASGAQRGIQIPLKPGFFHVTAGGPSQALIPPVSNTDLLTPGLPTDSYS